MIEGSTRHAPGRGDRTAVGRVGAARAVGLILAGSLAMLGIVLLVNFALYGTAGAFLGVALLALGAAAIVVCFREPRSRGTRALTTTQTPSARERHEL